MMKKERNRLLYISKRIYVSSSFSDDYDLFTESKIDLKTADICNGNGRLRRTPVNYRINNDFWTWENWS